MNEIDLDAVQEAKPYVHETQELEQTQLAVRVETPHPLDVAPEVFKAGLDRRRQNHKALIEWVRSALVEDIDFGKIHVKKKAECALGKWCSDPTHFSKDVLFKPGAEKIVAMLGVTPRFPTIKDYEAAAVSGIAIDTIILRCELLDSHGNVVAEGVGARSVVKEYGDTNKALKMAEKSGHIDATLRCAGLSEVFTQDLEDMAKDEDLTPILEASIEHVRAKRGGDASAGNTNRLSVAGAAPTAPPLKPEVQEMLAKAKANREAAEVDLRRGKEFPMESCPKCGGPVKVYTSAKGYKFEQCEAVRKDRTGRVHAEGNHWYRKVK